jgi:hypothetical protein
MQMAENHKLEDLAEVDRKYVGDEYKREVVEHMSIPQLVDTIMINPTVGQTTRGLKLLRLPCVLHDIMIRCSYTCRDSTCRSRSLWTQS